MIGWIFAKIESDRQLKKAMRNAKIQELEFRVRMLESLIEYTELRSE